MESTARKQFKLANCDSVSDASSKANSVVCRRQDPCENIKTTTPPCTASSSASTTSQATGGDLKSLQYDMILVLSAIQVLKLVKIV